MWWRPAWFSLKGKGSIRGWKRATPLRHPASQLQPAGQPIRATQPPFAQGGLDEALGLAVCLGRIRLGPDVLEAEIAAGGPKRLGAIARAIVGHHTGNRDAEVRVVGDRGLEEGDRALLFLVREDLREGHPGGVVDADVDELPSDASAFALTGSIAGDAMADPVEAPELFDIDVDQFAGVFALVAANRRGGFERLDAGEAEAPEDAADRGRR